MQILSNGMVFSEKCKKVFTCSPIEEKRKKLTEVTALPALPDRAVVPGDVRVGSETPHCLLGIGVPTVVMAAKTSCNRNY